MPTVAETYGPLLSAVAFAARAHQHQLRKDNQTPYASHPFRVCLIVRHVFGIDDPEPLTAAVLHDTIEDTPTDYDDLQERFGDAVITYDSPKELHRLIDRYLDSPEEKEEKGQRGRELMLAQHTFEHVVEELLQRTKEVMEEGKFRTRVRQLT